MRRFWITCTTAILGAMLLIPAASAQKSMPKSQPMPPSPPPATQPTQPTQQPRVVVVEPIRVFDPAFDYPYPYAYPPDYMAQNFGYVKIKTHRDEAQVFIDGGFADKIAKASKFALRPGNHTIELRDNDNRTFYKQKVYIVVNKTTELKVA